MSNLIDDKTNNFGNLADLVVGGGRWGEKKLGERFKFWSFVVTNKLSHVFAPSLNNRNIYEICDNNGDTVHVFLVGWYRSTSVSSNYIFFPPLRHAAHNKSNVKHMP
jgi:hypothetical protein